MRADLQEHVVVAEALGTLTDLGTRDEYDVGQAVLLERRDVDGPDAAAALLQGLVPLELAELLAAHRLPPRGLRGHEMSRLCDSKRGSPRASEESSGVELEPTTTASRTSGRRPQPGRRREGRQVAAGADLARAGAAAAAPR